MTSWMGTFSPARQAGNIADAVHGVVYTMFRGLVEGGGSRHVIAEAAAAVLRISTGSKEECGCVASVKVPEEIQKEVQPIAAALAFACAQRWHSIQGASAGSPGDRRKCEGIEQDFQLRKAWLL